MPIIDNDLTFLRVSVPEVEGYLLSDVLYYPITGDRGRQLAGDTTRLTLGNLLLSIKRIQAAPGEVKDPDQVYPLIDQVNQIHERWRSLWDKKVQTEIPNRMRLWKNYLTDWGDSPNSKAGDFRYNVRLRVILDLLMNETDALLVQEKSTLRTLDLQLKGRGTPGPFIWDTVLADGFPPDRFWFLYLNF